MSGQEGALREMKPRQTSTVLARYAVLDVMPGTAPHFGACFFIALLTRRVALDESGKSSSFKAIRKRRVTRASYLRGVRRRLILVRTSYFVSVSSQLCY